MYRSWKLGRWPRRHHPEAGCAATADDRTTYGPTNRELRQPARRCGPRLVRRDGLKLLFRMFIVGQTSPHPESARRGWCTSTDSRAAGVTDPSACTLIRQSASAAWPDLGGCRETSPPRGVILRSE